MKRAMIFVKGKDTEKQRELCEAYARKLNCTIKGTTENLQHAFDRSVEYDILITAGLTRLGRYKKNYEEVIELFDELGIEVKIAD